jgi:hypothetical protein
MSHRPWKSPVRAKQLDLQWLLHRDACKVQDISPL